MCQNILGLIACCFKVEPAADPVEKVFTFELDIIYQGLKSISNFHKLKQGRRSKMMGRWFESNE